MKRRLKRVSRDRARLPSGHGGGVAMATEKKRGQQAASSIGLVIHAGNCAGNLKEERMTSITLGTRRDRMKAIASALLTLVPGRPIAVPITAGQPLFFTETGHTVAYTFRLFWEQNGGPEIFGNPRSNVFMEQGRPVQYLERARLTWHGAFGVVLAGHLGRLLAEVAAGHPAFASVGRVEGEDGEYFVESGHRLRGAFQQFWHANGGLAAFGFPLSEEFRQLNREDGREYTVQYFERARFEWYPGLPPAHQVPQAHLGRQYLQLEHPAPASALVLASGPEGA